MCETEYKNGNIFKHVKCDIYSFIVGLFHRVNKLVDIETTFLHIYYIENSAKYLSQIVVRT